MSDANRTVTASTKLSEEVAAFLDGEAEANDLTRSELLRRLTVHYRQSCEAGLSCPHCKNDIRIDL